MGKNSLKCNRNKTSADKVRGQHLIYWHIWHAIKHIQPTFNLAAKMYVHLRVLVLCGLLVLRHIRDAI